MFPGPGQAMVWSPHELTAPPTMASLRVPLEGGIWLPDNTENTIYIGFQINSEYFFRVSMTHATFGTYEYWKYSLFI